MKRLQKKLLYFFFASSITFLALFFSSATASDASCSFDTFGNLSCPGESCTIVDSIPGSAYCGTIAYTDQCQTNNQFWWDPPYTKSYATCDVAPRGYGYCQSFTNSNPGTGGFGSPDISYIIGCWKCAQINQGAYCENRLGHACTAGYVDAALSY